METLLSRAPDTVEERLCNSLTKVLAKVPQMGFSDTLWQSLGLSQPGPYFAAILSFINLPPRTASELRLCQYLCSINQFYVYVAGLTTFSPPALTNLCRTLMRIDTRFDVKLISALAESDAVDSEMFTRVLSVLDQLSPGGRLTMTLARVQRDAAPAVASKVALLMGRRVSNPMWVKSQLASPDARTRANVVETLWGIDSDEARETLVAALADSNNRVVGNAVLGLYLLKDGKTEARVQAMAAHREPSFRMTAAWLAGRIGTAACRRVLALAVNDPDSKVRDTAERAFRALPAEEPKVPDKCQPTVPLQEQPAPGDTAQKSQVDNTFKLRLDGRRI